MSDLLFEGLRVVDVGSVIAAPVAAMLLADFGAEVIKIEPPGVGDTLRFISGISTTPDADSNYLWHLDGRNKRGVRLDLKTPEGVGVLHRLVERCDVYITNQPLPVRRSLGLTYDDLRPLNPSMVFASLTAFGEEGPERDAKGFDLVAYWARTGLMDLVRSTDAIPSQSLPGMGDHPTAISMFAGIVMALLKRERTGEGSVVSTSLLANGLWSNASVVQGALAGGDMDAFRERSRVPAFLNRVYPCSDGRYMGVTMVRAGAEIKGLFAALEATELLDDDRFKTTESQFEHRAELGDRVAAIMASRTSDEWVARFAEHGVAGVRIARTEEAIANPMLEANGMLIPGDPESGVPVLLNHPVNMSGTARVPPVRGPEHGEHSEEVLAELGYSAEEIADYRERAVI